MLQVLLPKSSLDTWREYCSGEGFGTRVEYVIAIEFLNALKVQEARVSFVIWSVQARNSL